MPVVIAPEEIDITNAGLLRAALLHAAARPGAVLLALTAVDRLIPVCASLDQALAHPAGTSRPAGR